MSVFPLDFDDWVKSLAIKDKNPTNYHFTLVRYEAENNMEYSVPNAMPSDLGEHHLGFKSTFLTVLRKNKKNLHKNQQSSSPIALQLPPFFQRDPKNGTPLNHIPERSMIQNDRSLYLLPRLTFAEAHSIRCHKASLDEIIFGRSNCESRIPSQNERLLKEVLENAGLTPKQSRSDKAGETQSQSPPTITALGLSMCMAPISRQWWWLLWAAILITPKSIHRQSNATFSEYEDKFKDINWEIFHTQCGPAITTIINTLSAADPTVTYVFPPVESTNGNETAETTLARHLIHKLSVVGFCFPFRKRGVELFMISPFLRLAVEREISTCSLGSYLRCVNLLHPSRINSGLGVIPSSSHYKSEKNNCLLDENKLSLLTPLSDESKHIVRNTIGKKRPRDLDSTSNYPSVSQITSFVNRLANSYIDQSETLRINGKNEQEGSIVVETNFRIYVYSYGSIEKANGVASLKISDTSPLLALVSQFSDHDITIPHRLSEGIDPSQNKVELFSVFRLTRPAFSRAYRRGISSKQIINFLSLRSHPSVTVPVPPSVQDQLKMWQETCQRLSWNCKNDPVVILTFPDEITMARIIGLGVPIISRDGLKVVLNYRNFIQHCSVGNI